MRLVSKILVGNSPNEYDLPLRDRMEGEELAISLAVAWCNHFFHDVIDEEYFLMLEYLHSSSTT